MYSDVRHNSRPAYVPHRLWARRGARYLVKLKAYYLDQAVLHLESGNTYRARKALDRADNIRIDYDPFGGKP